MNYSIVPVAELSKPDIVNIYEQLLQPAFRADELLDFEDLVAYYTGIDAEPSSVLINHGQPIGVLLAERYVDDRLVLLTYLAVAETVRGRGTGSMLMDDLTAKMRLLGTEVITVAEVEDPRVWPGDAKTGNAQARLLFYERRGARLIPVTYFQPRLRESGHRVPGMFLIRVDHVKNFSKELLGQFLVEYFTACEGPETLEDPDTINLLREVEKLDASHALIPLYKWPSMPLPL